LKLPLFFSAGLFYSPFDTVREEIDRSVTN
jgi:hypothetical protein